MSWHIEIIKSECTGCGICVDVCNFSALEQSRDMAIPRGHSSACTGCRQCEMECPFAAIRIGVNHNDISSFSQ